MNKVFSCLIVGISLMVSPTIHAQIVLQRCDVLINWEGSNPLVIDETDAKEGSGSLSFTGSETDWFKKVFSQTQVGIDETGYFSFWLYVSDVAQFDGDGEVEISSSGTADSDEYSWATSSLGLSNGWNHVILAISDAAVIGTPSLDEIKYFRIYQPLLASITGKIDFLTFSHTMNPVTSNKILDIKAVDNSTLDGKVMFGYQGWFTAEGDGSKTNRFHHWGDLSTGSGNPSDLSVEMWFDDRELDPDELYATGYNYPDGKMARAFSSYNKKTVMRHMKWLRDYDLDGVFLQRFLSEAQDPAFLDLRDSVTSHVKDGAERYGRTFSIMWDGINYGDALEDIKKDWMHLVDDLKVTESPNYLHHRGLPLISLWGYSVRDDAPVEHLIELIDFFHNNPEEKYRASIKVGCNQDWIFSSTWRQAFKNVEVISPWTVGRYGDKSGYENFADNYTIPSQKWCDENNVDFVPVNWPGFSWYNLHDGPKNQIKRRGGDFFWEQANGNLSRGAKSLYIAMFDEIDEATSMFKMPENASQSPDKGYWLSLDADGETLPSDWYLRCANLATEVTKGNTDNRVDLETPNQGIDVFTIKAIHETCAMGNGGLTLGFPSTSDNPIMKFSIDGGLTYPYTTPAASESMIITDLSAELYDIWISYEDGSYPTDLGDVAVVDALPKLSIETNAASCLDNGIMEVLVDSNPYMGAVEVSLDGGATYEFSIAEGVYLISIGNLATGSYDIWCKFTDFGCETNIGTYTIETNILPPTVIFSVYDEQLSEDQGTCMGSLVQAEVQIDIDVSSWKWTGPNGYSSTTAQTVISDSLVQEELGEYTVEYNDANDCKMSTTFDLKSNGFSSPAVAIWVDFSGELVDPSTHRFCEGDFLILEGIGEDNSWDWVWSGPNDFSKEGRRATLTTDAKTEQSGIYSMMVTDNNGCISTVSEELSIATQEECVLAVANEEFNQVANVYPNPTTGTFTVELSTDDSYILELLDIQGKVLLKEDIGNFGKSQIDMSGLLPGMFFLKLKNMQGQQYLMKILKK